jgi:hypothetical protein
MQDAEAAACLKQKKHDRQQEDGADRMEGHRDQSHDNKVAGVAGEDGALKAEKRQS